MTDINASLKKTINNEPGPQYKEKGKAEFNFSEGEDGKPYSYDRDVEAKLEELKTTNESRLTAIENKLDSVIENGSVNTQLTGSNVGYSTDDKDVVFPNAKRNDQFLELDTKDVYFHDGMGWVKW